MGGIYFERNPSPSFSLNKSPLCLGFWKPALLYHKSPLKKKEKRIAKNTHFALIFLLHRQQYLGIKEYFRRIFRRSLFSLKDSKWLCTKNLLYYYFRKFGFFKPLPLNISFTSCDMWLYIFANSISKMIFPKHIIFPKGLSLHSCRIESFSQLRNSSLIFYFYYPV